MDPTPAHGNIAGTYSQVLAGFYSSSEPSRRKEIRYVVTVESDNAWYLRFRVEKGNQIHHFDSLAAAVRYYDADERGKR